jgi:hypothetical protein
MSKESFSDAYSTAVIDSLPANPWTITRTSKAAPEPEKKPKRTAEDRRQYMNAYQRKRRKTDEFRAIRRQREALKRAATRVNPERSHGYTQADSDKTKRIAGKPNGRFA